MNESKIVNAEICQKCAKCCKAFSDIVTDEEVAKRYALLKMPELSIKEVTLEGQRAWRLLWNSECSALKKRSDGTYYCGIYDKKERPTFCAVYPDNFLDVPEADCGLCPELVKKA